MARLFFLDDFAGRVPDLGFHAPAADCADHGTVFPHQQLGALITGDGSAHLHDGGDGALLAQFAQAQQLLVDIHSSAIIARGGCDRSRACLWKPILVWLLLKRHNKTSVSTLLSILFPLACCTQNEDAADWH